MAKKIKWERPEGTYKTREDYEIVNVKESKDGWVGVGKNKVTGLYSYMVMTTKACFAFPPVPTYDRAKHLFDVTI